MPFTTDHAIEVLKKCYDPELNIDVWTLGIIYELDVQNEEVKIKMTFTTPACPYGPALIDNIHNKLKEGGAKKVDIELTFDPPWKPSEDLRAMMGM